MKTAEENELCANNQLVELPSSDVNTKLPTDSTRFAVQETHHLKDCIPATSEITLFFDKAFQIYSYRFCSYSTGNCEITRSVAILKTAEIYRIS